MSPQTPPPGRPALRMRWRDLLFVHWPVEPGALRALLPDGVELDAFDGAAWVGLVPFSMPEIRPAWLPRVRWRGVTAFHECNVRTYVTVGGVPGVWFFSLDAASRLAVWGARTFWRLPYFNADIALDREGDRVEYAVRRRGTGASLRCAWRVGVPLPAAAPGELEHFLTERYALFVVDRGGRLARGRIHHEPWPLRRAELLDLEDGLVAAAGIEVGDGASSLVHAADELVVDAWPLEPA